MLTAERAVERFGGGDEHVWRVAQHALALVSRGIAGAHGDAQVGQLDAGGASVAADAGEGDLEVALDVAVQRLEGGNVDHPDPRCPLWILDHPLAQVAGFWIGGTSPGAALWLGRDLKVVEEGVQAPQEGGERLTAAGGGEDESVVAAGDGGPALGLRRRGCAKGGAEPLGDVGREEGEWIGLIGLAVPARRRAHRGSVALERVFFN